MECGALVEDVLACKDHHEQQVQMVQAWQRGGLQQLQRLGAGYRRNAIFYGLVGGVFTGFGLYQYRFLGLQAVLLVLIGLFLLYASVANLVESRKHE
jgi:hypothetical protein